MMSMNNSDQNMKNRRDFSPVCIHGSPLDPGNYYARVLIFSFLYRLAKLFGDFSEFFIENLFGFGFYVKS